MFDGVQYYQGRTRFQRHFTGWDQVPAFDGKEDGGAELKCAEALDMLQGLKFWIRNVARHPNAFWLPLAGGRFYPDFVARMEDGRTLVVEYKGALLINDPDTKEKQSVGALWQRASDKDAVFVMVEAEKDGLGMLDQIKRAVQ